MYAACFSHSDPASVLIVRGGSVFLLHWWNRAAFESCSLAMKWG